MSDDRQTLDQLLEFPAAFTFRVVALERQDLREHCQRTVEQILGRPVERVDEQPSRSGRYRTVRLAVTVHEGAEITRSYEALRDLEGVKMLL
jgi:uncharacterized protein